MIGVCTKLTRALACSAASEDETGGGRRDCICSSLSFEACCDPCFSSAQSVKELGYDQPTDDQAEVLQKFVSGRDLAHREWQKSDSVFYLRFFSIRQFPTCLAAFFNWNSALRT